MTMLNELEFLVTFLPGESRALTRTGVRMHSLEYWADALGQWVGQHASVRVHYDPRDITVVYVRSPVGTIVQARTTTPGIQALSLAEWQAKRNAERGLARDPDLVRKADASLRRNDERVAEAKKRRSISRRRATAAAGDRWRPDPPPETGSELPPVADAIASAMHIQIYDIEENHYV